MFLKHINVNNDSATFFKVEVQEGGFLNWLSSRLGFAPITSLQANKDVIEFETFSIREGKVNKYVPINAVTAIATGWEKPFIYLVLALIFFLGSVMGLLTQNFEWYMIAIGLIITVILLLIYKSKTIVFFRVYNGGDKPITGITFPKNTIVEGVDDKINEAASLLNKAVLASRKSGC